MCPTPSPSSPGVEPRAAGGDRGTLARPRAATVFRVFIWLAAAALVIGDVTYVLRRAAQPDFMQFYFAGELAASGRIAQLYHPQAYDRLLDDIRAQGETIIFPHGYRFNRPAFAAFLCVPFSWFSYRGAVRVGVLANFVLLGLLVWKLPVWFPFKDFLDIELFGPCLLMFKPFVVAIGEGQDALLLTFFVAASLHLAAQGAEIAAGMVLALAVIKPHLIWTIPLALLVSRKWKMLWSFLATGAALAAVSFAAVGMTGIREWIELLRGPVTNYVVQAMANVWGIGLRFGSAAGVIAALLTLACFAVVLYRGPFADRFAAATLAALLLSPHTYYQDLSMLAIVAVLAAHAAPRYILVLPWLNFAPSKDVLLPWALLSLAYLAGLALKPQMEKLWRDRYDAHAKSILPGI